MNSRAPFSTRGPTKAPNCGAIVVLLATAWLALPAVASAHVGRGPVVSVSDEARITQIRPKHPPFQVRVIDGDQALWLRVEPTHQLDILGTIGEPVLRFDHSGVFVNTRSPTAQIDRIGAIRITPNFNAGSQPNWRKLTAAHSYLWHDHRLHALAPLGGQGTTRKLGTWAIPMRLDGNPATIVGELWYIPAPNVWLWLSLPLLLILAAAVMLRARRNVLIAGANTVLIAVTTIALTVARAGREFHARPTPALTGYISFAIGLALAASVLQHLVRHRSSSNWLLGLVVGVVAAVEALTLLPILYRGVVLAAIPATLERGCVALVLATGTATALISFVAGLHDITGELDGAELVSLQSVAPHTEAEAQT